MPTKPRAAKPRPVARKKASTKKTHGKPAVAAGMTASVRALERVAESLHFTRESFGESMLRLPRAEDYEPLTEPLGRLAAAVPALLQAISGNAVREPEVSVAVREAVASARLRLAEALTRLPRAEDYEPVARNLRELASVSPSLLDWLGEVPPLSAPLADSVTDLREALHELDRALALLGPDEGPRGAAAGPGRVKVIVRGSPHPA